MMGPDGWRWARIQWASGNVHDSRRIHYFVRGSSLCGLHHDGMNGWYTEVIQITPRFEGSKCRKCQKRVTKLGGEKLK